MNLQHCLIYWFLYPRQQIAFDAYDRLKERNPDANLITLSKEIHVSGSRRFLLSTYEYFFEKYRKMCPETRCLYEIIRYPNPCKLYFDIEYNKQINKYLNGDASMVIFKDFLVKYIDNTLQISITMENIMDLNSSDDNKFSRHLIVNFKNTLFNNNIECGIFVSSLCNTIINMVKQNSDDLLNQLIVNKVNNKKGLFIDQCVYTKNECFRLPFYLN